MIHLMYSLFIYPASFFQRCYVYLISTLSFLARYEHV